MQGFSGVCTKRRQIQHPQDSSFNPFCSRFYVGLHEGACVLADLFENYFPNSFVQADFLEFSWQDCMTMVDTLTGNGYGRVFITKNKSTEEALKVVRGWIALYGRPLEIRVDLGPAFRNSF